MPELTIGSFFLIPRDFRQVFEAEVIPTGLHAMYPEGTCCIAAHSNFTRTRWALDFGNNEIHQWDERKGQWVRWM